MHSFQIILSLSVCLPSQSVNSADWYKFGSAMELENKVFSLYGQKVFTEIVKFGSKFDENFRISMTFEKTTLFQHR